MLWPLRGSEEGYEEVQGNMCLVVWLLERARSKNRAYEDDVESTGQAWTLHNAVEGGPRRRLLTVH